LQVSSSSIFCIDSDGGNWKPTDYYELLVLATHNPAESTYVQEFQDS
jgi:hypothetical protein